MEGTGTKTRVQRVVGDGEPCAVTGNSGLLASSIQE